MSKKRTKSDSVYIILNIRSQDSDWKETQDMGFGGYWENINDQDTNVTGELVHHSSSSCMVMICALFVYISTSLIV